MWKKLGLVFHNENETAEMIKIKRKLQEKYVPFTTLIDEESEESYKETILPILFGGRSR